MNVHCPLSHWWSSKLPTQPAWGSPRRNWSVSSLLSNCWSPTARANAIFNSASLKHRKWRNFRTVRSQTRTNPYQQNRWLKPKRFRLNKSANHQRHATKFANCNIIVRKPKLSKTDSSTENGSLRSPDVFFNTKTCLERLSDWIVTYIQINYQYTIYIAQNPIAYTLGMIVFTKCRGECETIPLCNWFLRYGKDRDMQNSLGQSQKASHKFHDNQRGSSYFVFRNLRNLF